MKKNLVLGTLSFLMVCTALSAGVAAEETETAEMQTSEETVSANDEDSAASAEVIVESTIEGEACTNGNSTLKEEYATLSAEELLEKFDVNAEELTGPLEVEYSGMASITIKGAEDDSLIDASEAVVSLEEGDGYYTDMLILNNTSLDSAEAVDGQLTYTMSAGDLVWNNEEILTGTGTNGGLEWSCIGGDGCGNYTFRLKVSGIKYDGTVLDDAYFRIHVYIYGREFSGGDYGAGGYDDPASVLPIAEAAEPETSPETGSDPVFVWEGEGDKPILCDFNTDNIFVFWPEGTDASEIDAADVSITLSSAYGDTLSLVGADSCEQYNESYTDAKDEEGNDNPSEDVGYQYDYVVLASENQTQICVPYVYWAFTPVYTSMTIAVDDGNGTVAEQTFEIGSVYTHMVQTGGGFDYEGTVTSRTFYGIDLDASQDRIESSDWSVFMEPATYCYSIRNGEGPSAVKEYVLFDENGNPESVTEDREQAVFEDASGSDFMNETLVNHTVSVTNHTPDEAVAPASVEVETENGLETYPISYSSGSTLLPAEGLVAEPGYVLTTSSGWDTHQRWAWLYINRESSGAWLSDHGSDAPADKAN